MRIRRIQRGGRADDLPRHQCDSSPSDRPPHAPEIFRRTGAALSLGVQSPAIAQTPRHQARLCQPADRAARGLRRGRQFIIAKFKEATKGGIKVGNATVPVEVVVKDSQSNPNRAAEVAKELIVQDKIDLMLVASTPETTNPVSTQCEIEEVPCISTVAPWQPWFIGRQANPGGGPPAWKPFNYTYHYFWGLEDVIAVFTNMWSQLETNKIGRRAVSRTTATAMPGATSRSASRRCSTRAATSSSIPAATRT